jgi:hypothetical protein
MNDLKNRNSLIALAYIRDNENPMKPLCNHIMYCMSVAPEVILSENLIAERVANEFGMQMTLHLIRICMRILHGEKKIKKEPNGTGYSLLDKSFDLHSFDEQRQIFRDKEETLVNGLIEYVKDMQLYWTYTEARDHLASFLIDKDNAARLFIDEDIETVDRKPQIRPAWYVSKYITYLRDSENEYNEFLVDVVNGLMVYIGVYFTNNYEQNKNQRFKGTDFYIDTKLLLRVLGFSWELETKVANELIKLIRDEYGGNICVFEHTIGETVNALATASRQIRKGERIRDNELRHYAERHQYDDFDFDLFSESIKERVANEFRFRMQMPISFEDSTRYKYHLDRNSLADYIRDQSGWDDMVISNDVDSLFFINVLRKGDYSERFGGRSRLPIFITTNTALVRYVRNYISNFGESDTGIANWSTNALPIASDNMIMYQLWLPKASNHTSIPKLTLARNAYAAQQTDSEFYEKLKATANKLGSKHGQRVDLADLSERRKMKLEEILIKNTSGNIDDMEPDILTTSIDELIAVETLDLKNMVNQLDEEKKDQSLIIAEKNEQIIRSAAARYRGKSIMNRLFIGAADNFWLVVAFLIGIIGVTIDSIIGVFSFSNLHNYIFLVPILIFILEKLFERLADSRYVSSYLVKISVSRAWSSFSKRVCNSLEGLEKELQREILSCCLTESSLFSKYRKYIII